MPNNSKTLFESFTKKGMTDRDALFAVIDHWNNLHWHDRNLWADKIAKLEAGEKEPKVILAGQPDA